MMMRTKWGGYEIITRDGETVQLYGGIPKSVTDALQNQVIHPVCEHGLPMVLCGKAHQLEPPKGGSGE